MDSKCDVRPKVSFSNPVICAIAFGNQRTQCMNSSMISGEDRGRMEAETDRTVKGPIA